MNNSINLVFIIIFAVILGCTCQSSSNLNTSPNSPPFTEKSTPKTAANSSDSSTNTAESEDDDFEKQMENVNESLEDLKKPDNQKQPKPSSNRVETYEDEPPPPPSSKSAIPTMSQFNLIKRGMNYQEVAGILGGDGKLIKEDGAMKRYIWGDNNSFVMVSFQNDAVTIATQQNLR